MVGSACHSLFFFPVHYCFSEYQYTWCIVLYKHFGSVFRTILLVAGIYSFEFLGLGYRVDWPLNIILSPGALRIYSDIFSFLMQVKLAVFSLSDVWRSLKVLI